MLPKLSRVYKLPRDFGKMQILIHNAKGWPEILHFSKLPGDANAAALRTTF